MIDLKRVSEMISTVMELGLAMYVARELMEEETKEKVERMNEEMVLSRRFERELEKIRKREGYEA